eukprot:6196554-Pleurochrysis_carterae.AAC.7
MDVGLLVYPQRINSPSERTEGCNICKSRQRAKGASAEAATLVAQRQQRQRLDLCALGATFKDFTNLNLAVTCSPDTDRR